MIYCVVVVSKDYGCIGGSVGFGVSICIQSFVGKIQCVIEYGDDLVCVSQGDICVQFCCVVDWCI